MFQWLKVRSVELDVTLKEIFEQAGIDYARGYRVLSGFAKPDPDFDRKIQCALKAIEQRRQTVGVTR